MGFLQRAQQLLALAVRAGISTFILSSDDPHALRSYGEQVTPRLRELVEKERRALGTG